MPFKNFELFLSTYKKKTTYILVAAFNYCCPHKITTHAFSPLWLWGDYEVFRARKQPLSISRIIYKHLDYNKATQTLEEIQLEEIS